MIQSIVVYLSMMIFLVLSSIYVVRTPKNVTITFAGNRILQSNFLHPFIFILCLVFAIVFGARYDTGVDHLSYLNIYLNAIKEDVHGDLEFGFYLMTKQFARLGLHYLFYFGFLAYIQIFCFLYAFKMEQYLYPFLCFILMTSFFMPWMNVIRQNTVFCIFLCLIPLIEHKKFFMYIVLILFSSLFFHKSALFLILIYPLFFKRFDYSPPVIFQIIVYITVIYLNRSSWMQEYIDLIGNIASVTQYGEKYAERIIDFNRNDNFGPRVLLGVIINILTFVISPKLKEYYKCVRFDIIYTIYFYGVCLWTLFYGNFLLQRPIEYLYYMALPIYAYALCYLWNFALRNYKHLVLCLFYLVLQIGVFCGTIYSTSQPEEVTAFHFFWQKDKSL